MNAFGVGLDSATTATAVLGWIGQSLLFGSVLAAVTWLGVRIARRQLPPPLEMAFWCLVLIKFLVPTGPACPYSLASLWNRVSPPRVTEFTLPEVFGIGIEDGETIATDSTTLTPITEPPPRWPWTQYVVVGYLLVAVGLGATRAESYRLFRARCTALPPADAATIALVHDVCRRLNVLRLPLVRLSDEPHATFVMGFVRPLLVLSRRHLVRPDELETVIVHEIAHLRRGDLVVRWLQCFAGTILFFWPVVSWVNRRIDRARELACDEWALRHGRLTASEYARCLLSAVQPRPATRALYRPACMAGSPSTIERRIDVILTLPRARQRRPAWGLLAVVVLFAWGGFTLTGVAVAREQGKTDKVKYESTEKDMRAHAQVLFDRIKEYTAGDLDGDGEVTKEECWAFITAAVLEAPGPVLRVYPEADQNRDGTLDFVEALEFVRGDQELTRFQKKTQQALEVAKKDGDHEVVKQMKSRYVAEEMDVYHFILDRRDHLLDLTQCDPSAAAVKKAAKKMFTVDSERDADLKKASRPEQMVAEVTKLREEAAKLRAKAAEVGGAKADELEAKAAKVDEKAAQLKARFAASLQDKVAKLRESGDEESAAKLARYVTKLEAL